jgi:hypothetical protein
LRPPRWVGERRIGSCRADVIPQGRPVVFLAVVGEVFDAKTVGDAARAIADGKVAWEEWVTPALFSSQFAPLRVGRLRLRSVPSPASSP